MKAASYVKLLTFNIWQKTKLSHIENYFAKLTYIISSEENLVKKKKQKTKKVLNDQV
jgi:hypothetical protein